MAKDPARRKRNQIATIIIVGAVILFDLSPFGGNIRFYLKWLECGARPVQVASWAGVAWYEESPLLNFPRTQVWYCTPLEAERAGYSANEHSWEFPHIYEAGEENPLHKRLRESSSE